MGILRLVILLGLALHPRLGSAAPLFETAGDLVRTVSSCGVDVNVYSEGKLAAPTRGAPVRLYLTGAGVREKKLGFLAKDVYVLVSYSSRNDFSSQPNPPRAVRTSPFKALQLTLLMDVTGAQIREGFEEALDVNGIDLATSPLGRVVDKITFSLPARSVVTFTAYPNHSAGETLVIDTPSGRLEADGRDVADDFWSIWFNKPLDTQMSELQKVLTSR